MSWLPITTAPTDGTELAIVTAGGFVMKAKYDPHFFNPDGPDGAWLACEEDMHPPCWTDGACWAYNDAGEPSDPPAFWLPLPRRLTEREYGLIGALVLAQNELRQWHNKVDLFGTPPGGLPRNLALPAIDAMLEKLAYVRAEDAETETKTTLRD